MCSAGSRRSRVPPPDRGAFLLHRQAIFWRVIHCLLFISLYYQSREHSWTKMYESYGWSKRDAFDAWKRYCGLGRKRGLCSLKAPAAECGYGSGCARPRTRSIVETHGGGGGGGDSAGPGTPTTPPPPPKGAFGQQLVAKGVSLRRPWAPKAPDAT